MPVVLFLFIEIPLFDMVVEFELDVTDLTVVDELRTLVGVLPFNRSDQITKLRHLDMTTGKS